MPLSTSATNIFMALTLITWLVSGGFKERYKNLIGNKLALSAVSLYILICIGGLYAEVDTADIQFQLLKYSRLLFLAMAITLLQEEKWRDWGLYAFLISMLITLSLSLVSVVIPLEFVKGIANGTLDNHYVFKDHIAQNLMMSFFSLITLVKSRSQPVKLHSYIYLALAFASIIDIIFFVQGRTGIVSLVVNIFIFALFFTTPKNRKFWFSGILILGIILFFSSNNLQSRVELAISELKQHEKKELTSVGQRIEFLEKSIELIKERPLMGWGTGSYSKEFCRIAISEEWCQAGKFHPHNQFMAFGVQLGLLGILMYLVFLFSATKLVTRLTREEKVIGLGLISTLIIDSFLHAPLFLATETQFFILMLTIISAKK